MVCGSWRSHRATPSITPPASWGESRALVTRGSETGRGARGSPREAGPRPSLWRVSTKGTAHRPWAHRLWGHRLWGHRIWGHRLWAHRLWAHRLWAHRLRPWAHRLWGLGCPLPHVCFAPLVFQTPQAGFGTGDWGLIQTLPPSTTGDCGTGCQMRLRHLVIHKHFFRIECVPTTARNTLRPKMHSLFTWSGSLTDALYFTC